MSQSLRIGITQGDINGIGYEIIMKTLADTRILNNRIFIVYGSSKVAAYHRKSLQMDNFNFNMISSPKDANPKRVNIINCLSDDIKVELGVSTETAGEASYLALSRAVEDLKKNEIDVLVTAPINKKNINSEKFNFPGHTEYLADAFGVKEPLMFLVSEKIKTGVVTGHIPVEKVAGALSTDLIYQKIELMNKALISDFAIRKPRIAVLGLNPHAGDAGLLGKEEETIIAPAVKKARDNGLFVFGPFPADGFMGAGEYLKYDAVLGMYHDQVLIPFKVLAFEDGVNYTAGLPVVRTSPDHGTGYDIAGKATADENSFRQAIFLAETILKNRNQLNDLTENQLQPQKSNH